jgi:hypothetical protein
MFRGYGEAADEGERPCCGRRGANHWEELEVMGTAQHDQERRAVTEATSSRWKRGAICPVAVDLVD